MWFPLPSFGNLGPYSGNAYVFAEGVEGTLIEDVSDDGLITDSDQDGKSNGVDEDDPTVLVIVQKPSIGLAMEVTNISGSASSFSADYKMVVENLGNVPLSSVQIINDLGESLGLGSFTVSNLSVTAPLEVNRGFNGMEDDELLNCVSQSPGHWRKGNADLSFAGDTLF